VLLLPAFGAALGLEGGWGLRERLCGCVVPSMNALRARDDSSRSSSSSSSRAGTCDDSFCLDVIPLRVRETKLPKPLHGTSAPDQHHQRAHTHAVLHTGYDNFTLVWTEIIRQSTQSSTHLKESGRFSRQATHLSLSSKCRSASPGALLPCPKQISPSPNPAASAYPSRSCVTHISDDRLAPSPEPLLPSAPGPPPVRLGFTPGVLPISSSMISVMRRWQEPW
jgi:hypothetical protein